MDVYCNSRHRDFHDIVNSMLLYMLTTFVMLHSQLFSEFHDSYFSYQTDDGTGSCVASDSYP